jgi:hypothetical protein
MDKLKLRSKPESVKDVAGLKRQRCSRPDKVPDSRASRGAGSAAAIASEFRWESLWAEERAENQKTILKTARRTV